MAINFSNQRLVQISCDQVSSDSHDVTNLISDNREVRSKGFLVEYYIRAPVTIKINLINHKLDLMYIDIGLQVRQHKTNGIEVYVINDNNNNNNKNENCCNNQIVRCFGKGDNLTIINNGYRPSRNLPSSSKTFANTFDISGRNMRFCNNIKTIVIKIFSTLNSTVPCLSYLDIYGKPSGIYNEDLKLLFDTLYPAKRTPVESNCNETKQPTVNLSQIEHLAPLEFFDSITNELMLLPYLLPSGKNVDKLTLDKYLSTKNEIHEMVDPFTRLPFSDTHKPIVNVELKLRIDQFINSSGQSEVERRNELKRKLFNLN